MALVGTFVAIANRLLPPRTGWMLAGLFCLGLALANARTLFVALPVLLVVGLCAGGITRGSSCDPHCSDNVCGCHCAYQCRGSSLLRTETGRDLPSARHKNWLLESCIPTRTPTGSFASPPGGSLETLRGISFGREGTGSFCFELLLFDNDPRPHNTFLTVLYKMGLIGFCRCLLCSSTSSGPPWCRLSESGKPSRCMAVDCRSGPSCVLFLRDGEFTVGKPFPRFSFLGAHGLGLQMARMVTWNEHY